MVVAVAKRGLLFGLGLFAGLGGGGLVTGGGVVVVVLWAVFVLEVV